MDLAFFFHLELRQTKESSGFQVKDIGQAQDHLSQCQTRQRVNFFLKLYGRLLENHMGDKILAFSMSTAFLEILNGIAKPVSANIKPPTKTDIATKPPDRDSNEGLMFLNKRTPKEEQGTWVPGCIIQLLDLKIKVTADDGLDLSLLRLPPIEPVTEEVK